MPSSSVSVKEPENDLVPPAGGTTATERSTGQLRAVEHIRRMRGGSQSHLMRCSDGNYYVVKFPNNPQGARILANEFLGSRLATRMGLPVAPAAVVMVRQKLIRYTEELVMEMPHGRIPCQAGLCFGSRYPDDPRRVTVFDFLPDKVLMGLYFQSVFAGALVFDMWTCNMDQRQLVFYRQGSEGAYRAILIDQGHCFGGLEWSFSNAAKRCLYSRAVAYGAIRGIEAFNPWLNYLERFIHRNVLNSLAKEIPPEWYAKDEVSLLRLLDHLDHRRLQVRGLLGKLCTRFPRYFLNWIGEPAVASTSVALAKQ
ncbi:MAG: HipA family kinase [Candidatus Acidiferrales bacterium]